MITQEDVDPTTLPFIFKNKELTVPANQLLKDWLEYMVVHNPEVLKFLHTQSQEYVKHGGANAYTFERWKKKLKKDCSKTKEF